MNEPLYELVITNEQDGVDKISLVTDPAIMRNFITLSKEQMKFKTLDNSKRILVGQALIPDLKIVRLNEQGDKYYVYFSKETVEKIAHKFLKDGFGNNWNVQHSNDVNDVSVVESWIVNDPIKDKAYTLGLSVKTGDWMIAVKVDNEELWNEYIQTGDLRGFSVEVYTDKILQKQSQVDLMQIPFEQLSEEEVEEVWNKITNELDRIKND